MINNSLICIIIGVYTKGFKVLLNINYTLTFDLYFKLYIYNKILFYFKKCENVNYYFCHILHDTFN